MSDEVFKQQIKNLEDQIKVLSERLVRLENYYDSILISILQKGAIQLDAADFSQIKQNSDQFKMEG